MKRIRILLLLSGLMIFQSTSFSQDYNYKGFQVTLGYLAPLVDLGRNYQGMVEGFYSFRNRFDLGAAMINRGFEEDNAGAIYKYSETGFYLKAGPSNIFSTYAVRFASYMLIGGHISEYSNTRNSFDEEVPNEDGFNMGVMISLDFMLTRNLLLGTMLTKLDLLNKNNAYGYMSTYSVHNLIMTDLRLDVGLKILF